MKYKKALVFVVIIFFSFSHLAYAADDETTEDENRESQLLYAVIYDHILHKSNLGAEWANWIAQSILILSYKWGVHPLLVTALFSHESSFRPDATSPVGAVGIAQIMPSTAAGMGLNPYDPAQNIEGGIAYLAQQIRTFSTAGEWAVSYAIAAYNAGPQAVKDHGGIPPYTETINHINRIAAIYQSLVDTYNANL